MICKTKNHIGIPQYMRCACPCVPLVSMPISLGSNIFAGVYELLEAILLVLLSHCVNVFNEIKAECHWDQF